MNVAAVCNVVGVLLMVTGGSMLLPIVCSLIYQEGDFSALLISALILIFSGLPLRWLFRKSDVLNIREGILVAVFCWVVISAISALPFIIHGSIPSFTDAFFEMMSGYTTTGATILRDIESLPHGLLFWRSQTHLLGGMGFLTLTIIFLPHGVSGLRLFRAESSPGQVITRDRFVSRNRDAMIWLWAIYLGLNVIQTIFLWFAGMEIFDALCTSFGTVSTSGYSPKNLSIGYYNSGIIDWIVILFMFLGGMTFVLFFQMIKGNFKVIAKNTEFRWYIGFVLFFCGATSMSLWVSQTYQDFGEALRYGTFQALSLLTTTGFTTADYELWPQTAQMFLFSVCFIGACAGSTTSGIKVVHFTIIWKFMYGALKKIFIQPMSVVSVRLNGQPIDRSIIDLAVCYVMANLFLVLSGGCIMSISDNLDYLSAMSSVIAALMNIGPGFGLVGPSENYSFISDFGKWFLSWNMLVGRLEMFSVLVIFFPAFWKK
ncbi:MAG: TrkH family potassium uptake protein [Desulfobulbaceae bacterium]|nr:MAG: TrkH family potassium uptake protein [Desulfobulbaceae bacterium]